MWTLAADDLLATRCSVLDGAAAFGLNAFGLTLASACPWPWNLPNAESRPPLLQVRRAVERLPSLSQRDLVYVSPTSTLEPTPNLHVWRDDSSGFVIFTYADGITFCVDHRGAAIDFDAPDTASWTDVATYLLGPIVGLALRLRGHLCLHACVVEIQGQAVAIAGASGAGKSTLAAYFARQGHGVLTDDVAVLTCRDGVWHAMPGLPLVKLWPDGARAALRSDAELPRLTPADGISADWDKRYLELGERFVATPRPLRGIYVVENYLEELGQPTPQPLSPRASWLAMARHTYVNYVELEEQATEFANWSSLLRQVWVLDLAMPAQGAAVGETASAIVDDVHQRLRS